MGTPFFRSFRCSSSQRFGYFSSSLAGSWPGNTVQSTSIWKYDVLRIGLGHQQIEQRAVAVRMELVAVVVVVELDAVLRPRPCRPG